MGPPDDRCRTRKGTDGAPAFGQCGSAARHRLAGRDGPHRDLEGARSTSNPLRRSRCGPHSRPGCSSLPRNCKSRGTIRGLLRVSGLKIVAIHRNRFAARVLELIEQVALAKLSAAIEPLLRVREVMRAERKAADRTLAGLTRRSDVGRCLMTIPGVGSVTTLAYIATDDDPGRFGTLKALGAHLGLTPRIYQSGEIDTSGQISKCGDRMLRHLLVGADDAHSQVVSVAGLGCLRRQAPGHEACHRRRGAQACRDYA